MAKKTTSRQGSVAARAASSGTRAEKPKAGWQKPRITRHGNMRKLSQMSG